MKKWFAWIIIGVLIVPLFGCGTRASATPAREGVAYEPVVEQVVVEREVEAAKFVGGDEELSVPGITNTQRKIIYNVSLDLIVKDTAVTFEEVRRLTEERGGFVADSNTWKEESQLRGTVTVRIPVDRLEEALEAFRALAVDVESERMDSQDVTEEYVDLEARLTNLQRTEAELLELLETRSDTGKTSDILEVHRELTQIRAQIEQIQGRMKYLDNLAAMATVHIQLTPDALVQPVVVAGWRPQGTARGAVRALVRALQFFADALIVFFILILPILLLVAIPIALLIWAIRAIWKRVKRRKRAKETTTA
jgi:hypothetical protein